MECTKEMTLAHAQLVQLGFASNAWGREAPEQILLTDSKESFGIIELRPDCVVAFCIGQTEGEQFPLTEGGVVAAVAYLRGDFPRGDGPHCPGCGAWTGPLGGCPCGNC